MRNDLALRRAARGWSQERLAQQLDVSRQTIISIEKGRYDPSLKLAFRLARLFDCPIEEIFNEPAADSNPSSPHRSPASE